MEMISANICEYVLRTSKMFCLKMMCETESKYIHIDWHWHPCTQGNSEWSGHSEV